MLKKGWDFIKENVAVVITLTTALLTVVYATLRLCIYVYWRGYFTRLNIDISIINLDFDKSIFAVVFISIILFVVLFFMAWANEVVIDIMKKEMGSQRKGARKILYAVKAFGKALLLSFIILSIINLPLIMLLTAVTQVNASIAYILVLLLLLYIMEILFLFVQKTTKRKGEKKEKVTEKDIALIITEVLAMALFILATLFYSGTLAIDNKNNVQLVENQEYMISYCDGEYYVLHKAEYNDDIITVYRNEQKIVNIEGCEYSVKQVEKVIVKD